MASNLDSPLRVPWRVQCTAWMIHPCCLQKNKTIEEEIVWKSSMCCWNCIRERALIQSRMFPVLSVPMILTHMYSCNLYCMPMLATQCHIFSIVLSAFTLDKQPDICMLQTDLQPSAHFKAGWPVLKLANGSRGIGAPMSSSWSVCAHYFYVMPYVLDHVHWIC